MRGSVQWREEAAGCNSSAQAHTRAAVQAHRAMKATIQTRSMKLSFLMGRAYEAVRNNGLKVMCRGVNAV